MAVAAPVVLCVVAVYCPRHHTDDIHEENIFGKIESNAEIEIEGVGLNRTVKATM